jgi:hypothetical protein
MLVLYALFKTIIATCHKFVRNLAAIILFKDDNVSAWQLESMVTWLYAAMHAPCDYNCILL